METVARCRTVVMEMSVAVETVTMEECLVAMGGVGADVFLVIGVGAEVHVDGALLSK